MDIRAYQDPYTLRYVASFNSGFSNTISERGMRDWCVTTYGNSIYRWRDHIQWGEVHFNNEEDLTFFVMRWS